jgi:hypothetical protein
MVAPQILNALGIGLRNIVESSTKKPKEEPPKEEKKEEEKPETKPEVV